VDRFVGIDSFALHVKQCRTRQGSVETLEPVFSGHSSEGAVTPAMICVEVSRLFRTAFPTIA
jgi:hypothetical protein